MYIYIYIYIYICIHTHIHTHIQVSIHVYGLPGSVGSPSFWELFKQRSLNCMLSWRTLIIAITINANSYIHSYYY